MTRLVIPGLPHHVAQQGGVDRTAFFADADRRAYVDLVAKACRARQTQCLAWCLIDDRIELVLVPDDRDGLRATLAEAHRRYSRRINMREGRSGPLFKGRFESYPMQSRHLLVAMRHVERLPVTAGKVRDAEHWRWSSARAHIRGDDDGLTAIDAFSGERRDWRATLAQVAGAAERERIRFHLSTGRPRGAPDWIAELEAQTGRTLRPRKRGPKPRRAPAA